MKEGTDRIGLDGQASGAVTESEAEHAKQQLKEINKLRQQKQQEEKAKQKVKEKDERLNNKLEMLLTKKRLIVFVIKKTALWRFFVSEEMRWKAVRF